ncbi:hypothetical protein L9G74_19075 [Shewanella sp. C32]|uniref:Transmembrane protein n=1 Tax=Shewanella electrica TaxID=515560 RepID=A0ABT2FQC7_9GAMM|nr:hypothetical protein [Shewanella electrica]MCH1926867.1 hypothetical protein [Shewanella electrica]MCS4558543.1 hypothetical protein [Shewanella electrica]
MFKINGTKASKSTFSKEFVKQFLSCICFMSPFLGYLFSIHGYEKVISYMRQAIDDEFLIYSVGYSFILWVLLFLAVKQTDATAFPAWFVRSLVCLFKNGGDGWTGVYWSIAGIIFSCVTVILYIDCTGGDGWSFHQYIESYLFATMCITVRTVYVREQVEVLKNAQKLLSRDS